MSWQTQARELSFGSKRKVTCCSNDPSTYLNNSPKGISIGPCFRCGHREFEHHGQISAAQFLKWRKNDDTLTIARSIPPMVDQRLWPDDILVWLGRAGLSADRAESNGMGFHDGARRFILPVVEFGRTVGYTARSLERSPKYLYRGFVNRPTAWINGDGPTVVFLEDILSAVRVRDAGYRASAVLGTSFDVALLARAVSGATSAVGWFDPDDAGRKAYTKLRRELGVLGLPLRRVVSERDPKEHSRSDIINYIGE